MKRTKRFYLTLAAVSLLAVVCALGAGVVLLKAKSLYDRLSRKMDYISNEVYSIREDTDAIQFAMNQEYGHYDFDYSWTKDKPLIAHAFGGIDGLTYTNSYEAFAHNYALGHRVFEVDFGLSESGGPLICLHDDQMWREQAGIDEQTPCTHEVFMNSRIHGKYTPLDFDAVVDILMEYPDVYIVTDTKNLDQRSVMFQFAQMVYAASSRDESVLSRIIPQIYHEKMLEWIMAVYPFESVIYTLYATEWTSESVVDFCRRSGVGMVTMWEALAKADVVSALKQEDIIVAVHTVNDPAVAQACVERNVDMVYTDFLTP